MTFQEKVYNELNDSNFAAAVANFVQNYGRNVSSPDAGGVEADMGASEGLARSTTCCASTPCVSIDRRGSNKGVV